MENESTEIRTILNEINRHYNKYQSLDNDDLRSLLQNIQKEINKNIDKKSILDFFLPSVYAIVKETARRFTCGEIEVTANIDDRKFAEKFDFVVIEGDKAIYRNYWQAGGDKHTWKMVHFDVQMIAGVYLNNGCVAEMATGEGKTLVATLPVFLNALTKKGVHLMTVNDYLSIRDCELTRPIYMFHGLSVDCIEYYHWGDIKRKKAYQADITFGTNSQFAFDYLFDHLATNPTTCVQHKHEFALIDELDSILIDEADEPHIISNGEPIYVRDTYKEYKPIIEELVGNYSGTYYEVNKLEHQAWFTEAGKIWLTEKVGIPGLFDVDKIYKIDNFYTLPEEEQESINKRVFLKDILKQLLNAYTLYQLDVNYIVRKDEIVIIDQHTGRLKERSRWQHGLHNAVEAKECVKVKCGNGGSSAVISLKNYFKLYSKIAGMSGTVETVADELQAEYGLKMKKIATHRPLIREDKSMEIYKTKKAKDAAIVNAVAAYHRSNRPVLVGCLSIKRAEEISALLTENSLVHQLLTAKSLNKEAYYISKAGNGSAITVATSLAGRGTDIKLSGSAKENGGLVVVGTDLFESGRIDRQLKGRAGRQGDPGTSVFFSSMDDEIVGNLSPEDHQEVEHIVQSINSDCITEKRIVSYFEKAQTNRERYYLNRRRETARKDDVIAPYRLEFYKQRNKILFNRKEAERFYRDSTILMENHDTITHNISELYIKAKNIFENFKNNNTNHTKMDLPFSENKQLYVVEFEVEGLLGGFDYFEQEFKRQVILFGYDHYWIKFVRHLNSNLDQEEISTLPKEFAQLKNEVINFILSRLKFSTIPIIEKKPVPIVTGEDKITVQKGVEVTAGIQNHELCTCGSGIEYGECHGKSIRHKKRNNRR